MPIMVICIQTSNTEKEKRGLITRIVCRDNKQQKQKTIKRSNEYFFKQKWCRVCVKNTKRFVS